jgi:MYXO-CTERM domain-containing protein
MSKKSRRPRQERVAAQSAAPPPSARREQAIWKGLRLLGQGMLVLLYLALVALRFVISPWFALILLLGLGVISLSSLPMALYDVVGALLHLPVSAAQRQASRPVVVEVWWLVILVLLGLWLWRRSRRSKAATESSGSHWRWWVVLGFVGSVLLMGGLVYLNRSPLPPQSSFQTAVNALWLPVGLALLFFGIAMLALLIGFLQARWGEQAVERAGKVSVSIVGYGCLLFVIVGMLLAWYGVLRSSPPQNVLEWLAYLAFLAFLPGAAIFWLLRRALLWWRSSSRH